MRPERIDRLRLERLPACRLVVFELREEGRERAVKGSPIGDFEVVHGDGIDVHLEDPRRERGVIQPQERTRDLRGASDMRQGETLRRGLHCHTERVALDRLQRCASAKAVEMRGDAEPQALQMPLLHVLIDDRTG